MLLFFFFILPCFDIITIVYFFISSTAFQRGDHWISLQRKLNTRKLSFIYILYLLWIVVKFVGRSGKFSPGSLKYSGGLLEVSFPFHWMAWNLLLDPVYLTCFTLYWVSWADIAWIFLLFVGDLLLFRRALALHLSLSNFIYHGFIW